MTKRVKLATAIHSVLKQERCEENDVLEILMILAADSAGSLSMPPEAFERLAHDTYRTVREQLNLAGAN